MKPWELTPLLGELARARGPAAQRLLHSLRDVASAPWFDHRAARSIRAVCRGLDLPPPPLEPRPLAAGESWLLLSEPDGTRGRVARLVARPTAPATLDLDRATLGLRATCGRLCRVLPAASQALGFDVFGTHQAGPTFTGRSFGVAACAALISHLVGSAGRSDAAASAVVEIDGTLSPVRHLPAKVEAAREAQPMITRFVVASAQEIQEIPGTPAVEWVRAATLDEALLQLGVELRSLPPARLGDHRHRLTGFPLANQKEQTTEAWRGLARDAWETMETLAGPQGDPRLAAESGGWAALFALHAGDVALAERTLAHVRAVLAPALTGALAAWCAIIEASRAIDEDPRHAPDAARAALDLCAALDDRDRRLLRGMALGTVGRALMHAGDLAPAEDFLRQALAHHRRHTEQEAPRSGCYLATCLRLQGRAGDALSLIDQMLELCRRQDAWEGPATSAVYLSLEQGRSLLALGRPDDALAALAPAASSPADYPRMSALRARAEAYRRLGDVDAAWKQATACFATRRSQSGLLARIAALAAGDVLLNETDAERRAEARAEWLAVFPSDAPSAIAEQLRSIY